MADQSPSYSLDDSTLYLFTSLTAGSSHIITATSRLETILKANKIGFRAIDVATDDKARSLWSRRSKGRKLPGLVRYGTILAVSIPFPQNGEEQVEEWNEYGELKDQLRGDLSSATNADLSPIPSSTHTPSKPLPATISSTASATLAPTSTGSSSPHIQIVGTPSRTPSAQSKPDERLSLALRKASEEAVAKVKENTRAKLDVRSPSSMQEAERAVAEKAVASSEEKPAMMKEAEILKAKESPSSELKEKREESEPVLSLQQDGAERPVVEEKGKEKEKETDMGAVDKEAIKDEQK
ncbi:hypothetical protein PRK78_004125 [Emydomyces testavorans]|uniref:Uncharacterized protein n=1 Tax=Emydomyces testavorans TaxID=2070801 RepID=A0AAF0DJB7_9EURO|nr:hypothetical protein PRK78_004125 [Emydomyces testavorans]